MKTVFSKQEAQVIKAINHRTITIGLIVEDIYGKYRLDRANLVGMVIRRINAKCERHKLDWFINGAGGGRGGKLVWKESTASR